MISIILTFFAVMECLHGFPLRPGGKKMLFISINHFCGSNTASRDVPRNSNITDSGLCEASIQYTNKMKSRFWDFALEKGEYEIKRNITSPSDFQYLNLRFCTRQEAIQIVIEMKLNETFFVKGSKQTPPKWNGFPLKSTASRIMFVMINCPVLYVNIFKNNLFGQDYIVINLNSETESGKESFNERNLISSSDILSGNTQNLLYHLDTRFSRNRKQREDQVESFGIIFIVSEEMSTYMLEYEFLKNYILKHSKRLGKCFFIHTINKTDSNSREDLKSRLIKEKSTTMFILIGDPDQHTYFFNTFFNFIPPRPSWIVYDLLSTEFPYHPGSKYVAFIANGRKYFSIEHFSELVRKVKKQLGIFETLDPEKLALMRICSQGFEDQMLRMIQIVSMFQMFDAFDFISFKDFKKGCIRRSSTFKRGLRRMYEVYHTDLDKMNLYDLNNEPMNLYQRLNCPIKNCTLTGEEISFGTITKKHLWNISYGWTCRKCEGNDFKVKDTNETCQPCSELTRSTLDHGQCFDPFVKKQYPNLNQTSSILAVVACCLALIITLFTMFVEIKYKSTPFVKASDLRISLIHLTSKAIMFVIMPFLFLGDLNSVKCTMQPCILLVLCIFPSTLVLKKSQKIIKAFSSSHRLSRQKKRKILVVEYSVIFTIALVNGCILTASFYFHPAAVNEKICFEKLEKQYMCNTGNHINIQILLLIFHHLLSTVQAYRGRNLPGPFNEAMQIIYSSFVTVALYVSIFPIFYLSEDPEVKGSVHLLLIPIADCFFVIAFYFPRLYMVLWKSSKNTKAYVNDELMRVSQESVNRQMSSPT